MTILYFVAIASFIIGVVFLYRTSSLFDTIVREVNQKRDKKRAYPIAFSGSIYFFDILAEYRATHPGGGRIPAMFRLMVAGFAFSIGSAILVILLSIVSDSG